MFALRLSVDGNTSRLSQLSRVESGVEGVATGFGLRRAAQRIAPGASFVAGQRPLMSLQIKSDMLPSCPGSVRSHSVWQALPAYGRSCCGRAARPVRSQAEPVTEKAVGMK